MVNVFTDFKAWFPKLEYIVRTSQELELLKKKVAYVAAGISTEHLKIYSKRPLQTELEDLQARTRFENPGGRLFFLDDCTYSHDEADEITQRIITPYPIVELITGGQSEYYHKQVLLKQLFYPAREGRILTPVRHKASEQETNGIIILWPERRNKLNYVEVFMRKDSML